MSTEDNGEQQPKPDISAELLSKTDALAAENKKLSEQLAGLVNTLNGALAPKQTANEEPDDLDTLFYKDPKAYARKVQDNANRSAEAMINSRLNAQAATQQSIAQLTSDYPELADSSSDLTKKAVEVYNSLSAQEKALPSAYKLAVRDAASDLGILPKSKRKSGAQDDFAFGGGGSQSSSGRGEGRGGSSKLDNATLAFAEAMGMDIKDKKVIENLGKRAQRKSWNRYE